MVLFKYFKCKADKHFEKRVKQYMKLSEMNEVGAVITQVQPWKFSFIGWNPWKFRPANLSLFSVYLGDRCD